MMPGVLVHWTHQHCLLFQCRLNYVSVHKIQCAILIKWFCVRNSCCEVNLPVPVKRFWRDNYAPLLITIFDLSELNKDKLKNWGFPFFYSFIFSIQFSSHTWYLLIEFEDHKEGMNTNMNTAAAREQRGPSGQSWTSLTPRQASLPCQSCHIWKFSDSMLSSGSIRSSLNNDD